MGDRAGGLAQAALDPRRRRYRLGATVGPESGLANAPLSLFFEGAGHAGLPFPFPQMGMERREGARGLAKAPLAGLARPAARPWRGARPLWRSGLRPPGAPSWSSSRGLRRLDRDAHCRRTGPVRLAGRVMSAPRGGPDSADNNYNRNKVKGRQAA